MRPPGPLLSPPLPPFSRQSCLSKLQGSVFRVTFQLGHSLSSLAEECGFPALALLPGRGHRREVTFGSVPVNENLLSAC